MEGIETNTYIRIQMVFRYWELKSALSVKLEIELASSSNMIWHFTFFSRNHDIIIYFTIQMVRNKDGTLYVLK